MTVTIMLVTSVIVTGVTWHGRGRLPEVGAQHSTVFHRLGFAVIAGHALVSARLVAWIEWLNERKPYRSPALRTWPKG
jgi:hypothetical protein